MTSRVNYRVDGDKIIQEFVREQFSVSRADFEKQLMSLAMGDISTPPLPKGTRFFYRSNGRETYIVETRPGMAEITHQAYGDSDIETHKVSLPWQYFVGTFTPVEKPRNGINWQFSGLYLYWAKDRIKSLLDMVYNPQLPNVYAGSGQICLGETVIDSTLNPDERMESLIGDFYSPASIFNAELEWNIPWGDMSMWEANSEANPLWWREWRHFGSPIPFKNVLPALNAIVPGTPTDVLNQSMQLAGEALW